MPDREPGRDGARVPLASLKLDGGSLVVDTLGLTTELWYTDTCWARERKVCSGVCARSAVLLNDLIVGLSERLKFESEEEGLEGVCK